MGSGLRGRIRRQSMVSRSICCVSSVLGTWLEGLVMAGRVLFFAQMLVNTYRAHDCCLPVELSFLSVWLFVESPSLRQYRRNRFSRSESLCTRCDVPGRLRWDRHCMKREDHCEDKVSQMFLVCSARLLRRRHARAPRIRRLSCEQTASPPLQKERKGPRTDRGQ